MAIKDAILGEFDYEMKTTRALLSIVPESEASWKPHPKSTSLGDLASHLANILKFVPSVIRKPEVDLGGDIGFKYVRFENTLQMVGAFDAALNDAREAIASASDETMRVPWTLRHKDRVIASLPRAGMLRSFIMNHHIHHRGQLSVYLRMLNVPLPPMYGPTADG